MPFGEFEYTERRSYRSRGRRASLSSTTLSRLYTAESGLQNDMPVQRLLLLYGSVRAPGATTCQIEYAASALSRVLSCSCCALPSSGDAGAQLSLLRTPTKHGGGVVQPRAFVRLIGWLDPRLYKRPSSEQRPSKPPLSTHAPTASIYNERALPGKAPSMAEDGQSKEGARPDKTSAGRARHNALRCRQEASSK
jgi:hypothetical protein